MCPYDRINLDTKLCAQVLNASVGRIDRETLGIFAFDAGDKFAVF